MTLAQLRTGAIRSRAIAVHSLCFGGFRCCADASTSSSRPVHGCTSCCLSRHHGETAPAVVGEGHDRSRESRLGILTAGQATAQNDPHEYGPHWDGFGKRYGMRLTGVATEHAMEAGLGALWGEDPRYFRSGDGLYRARIKHVIVSTFAAYQADGHFGPAYARLIAMPGSNFLSNTWRADSESTTGNAWERTGWGFVGRMGSNKGQRLLFETPIYFSSDSTINA